jgi:uncharacterized membrane protein YvbJ
LKSPETCPNCGSDVPAGAKACPECGADEHTGWSEEAYASSLNLPEDSFDYDEFVHREMALAKRTMPRGIHWVWWVVAVAMAAIFVLGALRLMG